ncbi:MAG TPA: AI-2E family transporter, partial [Burkholderiales bacterium]|nr:AI-2E family transporter [Burkholderiales bacterium]
MKAARSGAAAGTSRPGAAEPEFVSGMSAPVVDPVVVVAPAARYSRVGVAVGVMMVIAFIAALYLARAFVVPLLIGLLASYALSPVVEWLKAVRIPRPAGAALVLAVLAGGSSWVAFSLSDDAAAMIEKLPEAARKLRQSLSAARASGPTALQNVQEAAKELEGATAEAAEASGKKKNPAARASAARDTEPTAWLRDYMLAQSALVITVVAQTPIVLLLAYFLLASGGHFRRKLVGLVGPSLTRKKDAVLILDEIDAQVQRYLLAMLVSNALVAVCTWLAFEALGMEQAGIWGVAAGVLHFIPYLGPALIALASGMAGFVQFGSLLHALAIACASLVVAGAIGFAF